MTDKKLRALERQWRQTGTIEDEATYLRELIRAGDLEQRMLELAGYCGHKAAQFVLDVDISPPPISLFKLMKSLESWGRETVVRAGISAASFTLGCYTVRHPDDDRPRQALLAACQWVVCPCEEHSQNSLSAGNAAENATVALDIPFLLKADAADIKSAVGDGNIAIAAQKAATNAALAVAMLDYLVAATAADAARAAAYAASDSPTGPITYIDVSKTVHAVITDSLIMWALGYGDPAMDFLKQNTKPGTD